MTVRHAPGLAASPRVGYKLEVEREKTSLTAVEVETLLSKLTGKLKVMTEGEVEVVTAKTLPAVVVLRPTGPVNSPMEVTPAPLQSEPVPDTTPEALACKHWLPDWTLPKTKEEMLVEPVAAATLIKLCPEVEATTKMGKVWEEAEATTYRLAPAGVLVLIIKDLTVLSQRKLAEPALVVAAVK